MGRIVPLALVVALLASCGASERGDTVAASSSSILSPECPAGEERLPFSRSVGTEARHPLGAVAGK